jgi:aldehyde:ferredoxin oxidoreductase
VVDVFGSKRKLTVAGISYRILEVDLSTRITKVTEYGEEALRKYFGGSGLAASILLDRFDSSLSPFHPQSPLIFMTGLFTGIPVPCGCRVSICTQSPLRIWGEANAGGYWGQAEIYRVRRAHHYRQSKEPSYLWVTPREEIK